MLKVGKEMEGGNKMTQLLNLLAREKSRERSAITTSRFSLQVTAMTSVGWWQKQSKYIQFTATLLTSRGR